ncbi:MAG: DNA adenine methylase [Candidatus Melainabacteria bacterium]|nr:DNA adenine methylase [Candidatus Melainabacteria bacterium]
MIKSPLRYPGGKSRVANYLISLFPKNFSIYCEPFLGGGSVALNVARPGLRKILSDEDRELVNFWLELQYYPQAIIRYASIVRKLSDDQIREHLQELKKRGDLDGPEYYVLNRCSFSGGGRVAGLPRSFSRFTQKHIDGLGSYRGRLGNALILQSDFADQLRYFARREDAFFFVDPPYINIKNLYRLKEIDQEKLARLLKSSKAKWLLTINDCEESRRLYNGCNIRPLVFTYSMTNGGQGRPQSRGSELVITNY